VSKESRSLEFSVPSPGKENWLLPIVIVFVLFGLLIVFCSRAPSRRSSYTF
jgi:hypothetical protein